MSNRLACLAVSLIFAGLWNLDVRAQQYQFSDSDPAAYATGSATPVQESLQGYQPGPECRTNFDCCNKSQAGGLYGGVAAVFAKPHLKEAFQYSRTNFLTGQQTLFPFEYDYQATPRVWLGYELPDGYGVKASWWQFDADGQASSNTADGINVFGAHAVNIIFPANIFAQFPGETLTNTDSLKTQIQNYYLTYGTNLAGFEVNGGLGLRYASLEQNLESVVQDQTGTPTRQLKWQRKYSGLGPSVSIDASKRIGRTPFSFVANAGGAFLFGTKTLTRTVLGDQSPQPTPPFLSLEGADEVVGIGELGLGAEWNRRLRRGRNLTIRGQYESQLWAEGGAPTLGFLGFEGFVIQAELRR